MNKILLAALFACSTAAIANEQAPVAEAEQAPVAEATQAEAAAAEQPAAEAAK